MRQPPQDNTLSGYDLRFTSDDEHESASVTGMECPIGQAEDLKGERSDTDKWQAIIDTKLIEWGYNPNKYRDEEGGIVPPTRRAVNVAVRMVHALRQPVGSKVLSPPRRVVMDGDGGISFEFGDDDERQVLQVDRDGSVEALEITKDRLVSRMQISM